MSRKRIPQHFEYAVEDIEEHNERIARLAEEIDKVLHDRRGVNKYKVEALAGKIATSSTMIARATDSIERREPLNGGGANPRIDRRWLDALMGLVKVETPHEALEGVIAAKREEFGR